MNTLEQAVRLSMEEWAAALPEEIPAYTHSAAYKKAIRRLFDKTRNNRYHRLTKRTVKALLIAAILLAIALAATAIAVPKENNVMLQLFDGHAEMTFTNKSSAKRVTRLNVEYIPEGFELTESESYDISIAQSYTNGDLFIDIQKTIAKGGFAFDTTDLIETITNDDIQYTYAENSDTKKYIWTINGYAYMCRGNIDKELLFEIVKHIY